MSNKIDSKPDSGFTPDGVPDDETLSLEQKRERLTDMKFELERQAGRGGFNLDEVEASMAAINMALARAKAR